MSRIRNFFAGVGSIVLVILLLPELQPFFVLQSDAVGGVPGSLFLLAAPVVLLSLFYGLYLTTRPTQDRGMR